MKRAIDLLAASVGLVLLGLLFPFLALAIYVDSPGPLFYKQRRAATLRAAHGTSRHAFDTFEMLKFRSMHVNAEARTGAVLAEENDPRITRVGRFLRKTRLDELPQ
ncbi:MAG TPA: sugar transferase, partial [Polyangiaceae bacterium]